MTTTTTGAAELPEALYADAVKFAKEKASIAYVQRKCRCSFNNAKRMLERMVREGIIASYRGRKAAAQVEALSAAQAGVPAEFLQSVIALCTQRGFSPANIEAWSKDDKWIADLWRQAEKMLAAAHLPTTSPAPADNSARTDALCDSSYLAGATVGFNLGIEGDYEGLSRLSEVRQGYLKVLTAARAAPQPATADANWEQLRSALAMLMLGWLRNSNQTMEGCNTVLDSVTEPGMPLALLRSAPDWREFMAAQQGGAE